MEFPNVRVYAHRGYEWVKTHRKEATLVVLIGGATMWAGLHLVTVYGKHRVSLQKMPLGRFEAYAACWAGLLTGIQLISQNAPPLEEEENDDSDLTPRLSQKLGEQNVQPEKSNSKPWTNGLDIVATLRRFAEPIPKPKVTPPPSDHREMIDSMYSVPEGKDLGTVEKEARQQRINNVATNLSRFKEKSTDALAELLTKLQAGGWKQDDFSYVCVVAREYSESLVWSVWFNRNKDKKDFEPFHVPELKTFCKKPTTTSD